MKVKDRHLKTDIGIAVFHALWTDPADPGQSREAYIRQFLHSFWEGYGRENHLEDAWLERLPQFCKYRRLLSFTVFHEPWSADDAAGWQREWVATIRQRIVEDVPVIEPDVL